METLASRIKLARKWRDWTQQELSEASGVKQSDISKLERGNILKSRSLPALAHALLCDPNWLATGGGEPDFGNVRKGWPFPSIERGRFVALSDAQRKQIEGAVLSLILEFEAKKPSVKPFQALNLKGPTQDLTSDITHKNKPS